VGLGSRWETHAIFPHESLLTTKVLTPWFIEDTRLKTLEGWRAAESGGGVYDAKTLPSPFSLLLVPLHYSGSLSL
jgi:hypothetical protein